MHQTTACELFHRCVTRRGGRDWQEFLRRYGRRVREAVHRALRRCGLELPEHEREELVQEMYCRLLTSAGRRFRGRSEPELWGYLNRIAYGLLVDRGRAAGAGKRRLGAFVWDCVALDEAVSHEASPEERLLADERRRMFLARCRQLFPGDRDPRILRLALLEGWSSREIARRFEGVVTPSQVDRLVYHLRHRLAREGIELPRRQGGTSPLADRREPEPSVSGVVC